MPEWARFSLLIAAAAWCLQYFAKMLWIGLRTGRVIDSQPLDGKPATRGTKPLAFWLSMIIAGLALPAMVYLVVLLSGDLLGFWTAPL